MSRLIKENIIKAVKSYYGVELTDVHLEHPENDKWGDFASNVPMTLAKEIKQSPIEIAKNVCYEIQSYDLSFTRAGQRLPIFEKIEIAPPGFVNFKFCTKWLHNVLYEVVGGKECYGTSDFGASKKVLVEFSQPNPNKPLHIGHARNNFLGSSLASIFKAIGYDVIAANYMNDWGTHICKSMLMYKKYGNGADPDKKSDHYVGDFYARYEKEVTENPELEKELSEMFRNLEAGDSETTALWEKIVSWAVEGWNQTYKDENVNFDIWMYQHDYKDSGKEIVKIALEKGIAEKDETGAIIARLEKYDIPDKVLLRSDGTSIYSTQDLQLAKDSFERYQLDKRLYVVDYRQGDYFKQIFKILEVLGFDWAKKLYHVAYGVVKLPEGQMSSRKGNFVSADEVYTKLVELESPEVARSLGQTTEALESAKKIALAAFRYGMLKVDPLQDITFDFSYVTKFDGNTGPYLMYTYARTHSLLSKSDFDFKSEEFGDEVDYVSHLDPREEAVLRQIYKFPEEVQNAAIGYAPNVICNYLFDLAQKFNTMYATLSVLNSDNKDARNFRLLLTESVGQVMKNGLNLLGIDVVERM